MLSGAHWSGGRLVLLADRALTRPMRDTLASRAAHLDRALAERDRGRVGAMVAQLLAGYSSARASGDEARFVLAAYVAALDDIPPWAVVQAVRGFQSAGSAFAPSASELKQAALKFADPYRKELHDIRTVIDHAPTEPTPEERRRVAAGFDRLTAGMRGRVPVADSAQTARDEFAARCAELGIDPDSIPDQPAGIGQRLRMELAGTKRL